MIRPTQRQIAAVVESARGDAEEHNNFAAVFRGRAIVAIADDLAEARALLEAVKPLGEDTDACLEACNEIARGVTSTCSLPEPCWEHRRQALMARTK